MPQTAPKTLWSPDAAFKQAANLTTFTNWLADQGVGPFSDYEELWAWSVEDVDGFWRKLIEYFDIKHDGPVGPSDLSDIANPTWFEGMKVNYAEHSFAKAKPEELAMICMREDQDPREFTNATLHEAVACVQGYLKANGVVKGDRVVGFMPNTEHAIVVFLAVASLGAIWSCCSPDFGAEAVYDRFIQLEPKVLFAIKGYGYGGKYLDRSAVINELADRLPTLQAKVCFDLNNKGGLDGWTTGGDWPKETEVSFERVEFDHPLWIVFSSGTTGKPKPIVHGHGGCLLEHMKYMHLQADVCPRERFFWFTTTGWMMWNFLQASLLVGAVPILYDGSPGYPNLKRLWGLAAKLPIHHFGTSAPFIHACLKKGIDIMGSADLTTLRSVGSTGSPLSEEGFEYMYEHVKKDLWLSSMSGGTDVCTAFVGGNPWTDVRQGVIQGRALGCDLRAFDENNQPVIGEVGELVVCQPMPSMPVMFWNDTNGEARRGSYFEDIPGVWRHGDFITIDEEGGIVIHGRSDATLNRQGVRIGTAEIYRVLENMEGIEDSLIINYATKDGGDEMPLFVKLAAGVVLDNSFRQNIKRTLRTENSPRHVPTRIEQVEDIPYTISGKKLEAPVKKLFMGHAMEKVAKLGSLRNPDALLAFATLAAEEL
ncbi:MAG: acetoacetate--CoA ligase [Saprospiraceae bacterium]